MFMILYVPEIFIGHISFSRKVRDNAVLFAATFQNERFWTISSQHLMWTFIRPAIFTTAVAHVLIHITRFSVANFGRLVYDALHVSEANEKNMIKTCRHYDTDTSFPHRSPPQIHRPRFIHHSSHANIQLSHAAPAGFLFFFPLTAVETARKTKVYKTISFLWPLILLLNYLILRSALVFSARHWKVTGKTARSFQHR